MAKNSGDGAVLITRFSALGDVAIALPVVYDVCRAFPFRQFVLLTKKGPAAMFINPPANLTVEGASSDDLASPLSLLALFRRLNARFHFSAYADLHDVLRTKIFRTAARLSGISHISHIRKGRREKKALTRRNSKMLRQLRRSEERYRDVFAALGLYAPPSFSSVFEHTPASPSDYSSVSAPKSAGETWIGIAPFAKHTGKIYPADKMQTVVDTLASRPGYKIFLFGAGEKEREIMARWQRHNVINMASVRLGFKGELSLISALDAMLTMDSANMHLAALTGTRTLSIWGATHPYTGFIGYAQSAADTIQLPLPCRPCSVFGQKPCHRGDYLCLTAITPAQIISALDATQPTAQTD